MLEYRARVRVQIFIKRANPKLDITNLTKSLFYKFQNFYVWIEKGERLVSIMLKIQMLEHIVTDDSVADEIRVEREEREEQLNDE